MNKKIYGVSVLGVENGMWNADFTGFARSDSHGNLYATDKARKYSIRQALLNNGFEVLIRRHKEDGKYLGLKLILEKYKIPTVKDKANESAKAIFKKFIDVRLFGAIVNPSGNNILTVTGPVQFQFGVNRLKDSEGNYIIEQKAIDITSYKTSKDEQPEDQTTIGTQNIVEKAYYVYTFVINPNVYKQNCIDVLGEEEGLEFYKNNYDKDVKALLNVMDYDVTDLNSCTKVGCTNKLNVFITMKDESTSLTHSVLDNITIKLDNDKVIADLSNINELVKSCDTIESVKCKKTKDIDCNIEGDIEEIC